MSTMAFVDKMLRVCCIFLLSASLVCCKSKPETVILTEDTWTDLLQGEWLVKFYAPWCPACRALVSVWDEVAGWSEDLNIKVAKIDVTENPGLSGRFLVTSLPTIYHVKNGEFRQYRGSRDEDEIIGFVDDKKWEDVEPLSWYTAPTSIHMGALGWFFKASMAIRDLHDSMTTQYGIPVWGSYTIFAVATIILGLLIGLLIVFLCDYLLPNNPPEPSYLSTRQGPMAQARYNQIVDDDDKDSDVIEDDLPPRPKPSPPQASPAAAPSSEQSSVVTSQSTGGSTQSPKTQSPGGTKDLAKDSDEEGKASQDESQDDEDWSQVEAEGSQENSQDEGNSQEEGSRSQEEGAGEGAVGGDRPERPKSARRRKLKATTS